MATYFHGAPEIQPDSLQTLYLMNPSYVAGYSDAAAAAAPAAQQASMVFLNSPLSSLSSISQPHQQQQQQHFVGIPLQPLSNEPNRPLPSMQPTSIQYNLWAPAPSANAANPVDIQAQLGPRRPGLSLSLSPQQAQFAAASSGAEEARFVVGSSSSDGPAGLQSVLMGSKYLRAAQQLLDEVVSVGRGEAAAAKANDSSTKIATKSTKDLDGDGDGNGKKAAELSTAERQELQMKKAKLVNMLDEVEQRYRQYHHQMQVVVSSFEAVAGAGSAKTYTALALQTISKQFRCLRDAISGQIKATGKSLGEEEDCMAGGGSKSVGSRLRFVDHQLRQQRALQQLGMIQHNAWRPQRGLPERAVSVLRAWLFEHFLHPYPKDSDKHMLAKQTGLTRSQVSNWFINARVRLWKPMVEEMYLEETKDQEQKNGGGDKASKSEDSEHSASKSASQQANSSTPSRTEQTDTNPPVTAPSSDLAMFSNHSNGAIMQQQQQRLKKQRSDMSLHQNAMAASQMSMEEMKPDELSNRELLMKFMDQGAGFGGYPIGGIGRFDHEQFAPRFSGNGVSLTLGLPHCETLSLSGSQQANYLSNDSMPHLGSEESNYFSLSNSDANNPTTSNAYESINIQNRKRFAARLLPDFVA